MADGKIAKGTTTLQSNASSSEPSGSVGTEDVIGHSQDLKRNYSLWSILGAGFSLTNSWVPSIFLFMANVLQFGVSIAMVTGINSGGPVLLVYGIIIVMLVSICVGISLSELASALPNTGGQYFWAAPIFSCASTTIGVASGLVGCWQLSHPDYIIKDYHVFVTYLILTWVCFLFNCYGKILPSVATTGLYCSLISFIVILATVPVTAPSHQTPKFVFATFINNTGWSNAGIAFVTGLINANWAFACLDCATHLAEEVHQPERMIPIAFKQHCWSHCPRGSDHVYRDSGVPGHKWLQKIDHKLDVPLNAHFTSCLIVTIVGCMYLASTAAFNAMSSAQRTIAYWTLQHGSFGPRLQLRSTCMDDLHIDLVLVPVVHASDCWKHELCCSGNVLPSLPKFQAMACANERQALSPPAQLAVPLKSCARLSELCKPRKPFLSLSRLFAGLRRHHFDGRPREAHFWIARFQDRDRMGKQCEVEIPSSAWTDRVQSVSQQQKNVTLTNLRGARLVVVANPRSDSSSCRQSDRRQALTSGHTFPDRTLKRICHSDLLNNPPGFVHVLEQLWGQVWHGDEEMERAPHASTFAIVCPRRVEGASHLVESFPF
ncbi:amino acid transporter, partial [Aureobasidium sp. EXF-3399]